MCSPNLGLHYLAIIACQPATGILCVRSPFAFVCREGCDDHGPIAARSGWNGSLHELQFTSTCQPSSAGCAAIFCHARIWKTKDQHSTHAMSIREVPTVLMIGACECAPNDQPLVSHNCIARAGGSRSKFDFLVLRDCQNPDTLLPEPFDDSQRAAGFCCGSTAVAKTPTWRHRIR